MVNAVIIAGKKFCHGECQAFLPPKKFPKNGGRFCKRCASEKQNAKYHERKKEREAFSHQ